MRNFERCQEKLLLIYFKKTVFTIVTTKRVQHTLRHFNVLISLSEYFAHSYNPLGTEKGNDYSAFVITEILRAKNKGARPNLGKHL